MAAAGWLRHFSGGGERGSLVSELDDVYEAHLDAYAVGPGHGLWRHPELVPALRALGILGYSVHLVPDQAHLRSPERASVAAIIWPSRARVVVVERLLDGSSMSIEDIAFALAHELRHALHIADGLYPRFYAPGSTLPGYDDEVEDDCDAYAMAYVSHHCRRQSRIARPELANAAAGYLASFRE